MPVTLGEPMTLTPTQRRILDVLGDGLPHTLEELARQLWDEDGAAHNVHRHLYDLRRKLRPAGEDILCVYSRKRPLYRRVRLLHADG